MLRMYALSVLGLLFGCSVGLSEFVRVVESPEGFLFEEVGKRILFYQRAPKSSDGGATRNNYIHPLWNLEGDVLTEDAPDDHLHHRGIFWAWHQTTVGDVRCGDAWLCERFSWDVTAAHVSPLKGGAQKLDVTVLWRSPDYVDAENRQKPIIQENTAITVYPHVKDFRVLDFEIRLLALQESVAIGGSEDVKGYGGFSLRLKTPEDLTFQSDGQTVIPQNETVQAGGWMAFNATFNPAAGPSGIAVFVHPHNPGATGRWILRQKASMQNAVYPGRQSVVILKSQPTVLKYRLVIYNGDGTQVPLGEMYRVYICLGKSEAGAEN
ncbi:DUF6807 family protein [Planctomycetota bacterium]